jgi:hypothetical protein
MRKFIISIATLAAVTTFAGMSSAVTALSETHFASSMTSAHHQFRVNDTVPTVHGDRDRGDGDGSDGVSVGTRFRGLDRNRAAPAFNRGQAEARANL